MERGTIGVTTPDFPKTPITPGMRKREPKTPLDNNSQSF
jgi:hypothetical protein